MNKKIKRILVVVGLAIAIAAIGAVIVALVMFNQLKQAVTAPLPSKGLDALPCEPKSRLELGSPYTGGETAEFTTSGSDLYLTARYFHHGGIFDLEKWITSIYVGQVEKKPLWDNQRNRIDNVFMEVNFTEGYYGKLNLPAGRYWLWSGAGDVVVYSCDSNGVSDPKPVR